MILFSSIFLVYITHSQSIFDARVYNFYFYLNTNPDLTKAGITNQQTAQQHWQNYGIHEGRQACGSFHSLQFLDNYPSLKKQFGSNYTAAILYYLNVGYNENLYGYTPNVGAYGRYTISSLSNNTNTNNNSTIWLSGSDRMAGAIDSIVWNGFEFINCWDHGRELQMAVTTYYGECYNPTEAGSGVDLQQTTTTSILESIAITNNIYSTTTLPAFWMIPGQYEAGCGAAKNTVNVSQFAMNKRIEIGYKNVSNVIYYTSNVLIPMDLNQTQIEAPTAYLNAPFNVFYAIDLQNNGNLTKLVINDDTGGHLGSVKPVIIATNDDNFAQGVLAKVQPQRNYALYNFVGLQPPSNGPSKWSVVTFFQNVRANTKISFENFICVGTLNDVKQCMINIYNDF